MRKFIALLAGLLFGIGLLLAGMANPAKVLGFLDITGDWDPSLALVMMGAIAVAYWPFKWAGKHPHSMLGAPMQLPANRALDKRLLVGALLFGIGWGLAGICPGPALVLVFTAHWQAWLFVASMLTAMWVLGRMQARSMV